ncbi:lipoyl synthase [Chloroflexota bacterium]
MPRYDRRPEWLKITPLDSGIVGNMGRLMRGLNLHTVCVGAQCPNRTECFGAGTATFMILGDVCTRNCTFCSVKKGKPLSPDFQEPEHLVEAVEKLGLRYVVVTSVTRDDLPDGGASHFAQTVRALFQYNPNLMVEVLIPDFKGSLSALENVVAAHPSVLNHNVETIPRLYSEVRPMAEYRRSIDLLRRAKTFDGKTLTKSGLMLGLGESRQEVIEVINDLVNAGCDLLTLGQYLQPSFTHHRLVRYIPPEEFDEYKTIGEEMGFATVVAGPLVRSSFHAAEAYLSVVRKAE